MNGLAEGIQNSLRYIEEHLTEELSTSEIAAQAHLSPFHFQRIFSALCGFTVYEYIRMRRLTLAGEELSTSEIKVIDAALKYGYDSPDSFSRAFTKFHGISPSAAKERGAGLKAFAPLRIKLTLEGGNMTDYKIMEKAEFTVMGKKREFNPETSYTEIPLFWKEHYESGGGDVVMGMFGVCLNDDGKEFDYLIADLYSPWKEIPDSYETRSIPAGTWAVFPCVGECPKSLQDVNTKIWSEWLPNCKEYRLAGNYSIEFYIDPTHCEIWVPVERN